MTDTKTNLPSKEPELSLEPTTYATEIVNSLSNAYDWNLNKELVESTKTGEFNVARTFKDSSISDIKQIKQFYLNLTYLLSKGFNTLFVFANNPYLINQQKDKIITSLDKERNKLSDESILEAGYDSLPDGLNDEAYKSAFNIENLHWGNLEDRDINEKYTVAIATNWSLAFVDLESNLDHPNAAKHNDKKGYLDAINNHYKLQPENFDEIMSLDLNPVKWWAKVPWDNNIATNQDVLHFAGYVFPPLSKSYSDAEVSYFFSELANLKKIQSTKSVHKNTTFITMHDMDESLLYAHFTTNSGYMNPFQKEALDYLSQNCLSFLDLVKSLPDKFNHIDYVYEDYSDTFGNKQTKPKVHYDELLNKWLNINLKVMHNHTATTYQVDSFFIKPGSPLYKPLALKSIDDLIKSVFKALINIVKFLLMYRDESGNYLVISDYFEK